MPSTLGIDVGTTSIKVCLLRDGTRINEWRAVHGATMEFTPNGRSVRGVQSAHAILKCTLDLLEQVREEAAEWRELEAVAVSGQMHGVAAWSRASLSEGTIDSLEASPLYTWEFDGVPEETSPGGRGVHGGYGCVTLAWLSETGNLKEEWDAAGTIMDLLVDVLAGKNCDRHPMTSQNAWDFGFYAHGGEGWTGLASTPGPWQRLLPRIVPPGCTINAPPSQWLPATKILVPLGDLQATLWPVLTDDAAVLNLGTSSQLVLKGATLPTDHHPAVRVDPYFEGTSIIIAASLNGGNVVEAVANKVHAWSTALGQTAEAPPLDLSAVLGEVDEWVEAHPSGPRPTVDAALFGERGVPTRGLSLHGVTVDTAIQEVLAATCSGIVRNQLGMMPWPQGVKKVIVTGAADRPRFARPLAALLPPGVKIVEEERGEISAAFGGALYAYEMILKESAK